MRHLQKLGYMALGSILTVAITGTALAASGALTLEVVPVSIKVNDKNFEPKSSDGSDAMVFAYDGVTYAPLRALANAYGLEVGWDQESGTATVNDPDATPSTSSAPDTTASTDYSFDYSYDEFKGLWATEISPLGGYLNFRATDTNKVLAWWNNINPGTRDKYLLDITHEEFSKLGDKAPPKSIFSADTAEKKQNLAIVFPANNDEINIILKPQ